MRASQVARRIDWLTENLYREMIKVEKLAERASGYVEACHDLEVPDGVDRAFRINELHGATGLINQAWTMIAGIEDALQSAVLLLEDAQEKLIDVDRPRP